MDYKLTKKDGVVTLEPSFEFICSTLRNGTYTLSIKRKAEPRTISQNNLMWLWFACLEAHTGQDKNDWHEYYKQKFLSKIMYINGREIKVPQSTATLTTAQMSAFLTKIQADALTEFGCTLPLPQDRYYAEFVDHYKYR